MAKLQDGLMLFTRDSRVVLVSASAEKFLSRPRREILGRSAEEIFSDGIGAGSGGSAGIPEAEVRWGSMSSMPPTAGAFRFRWISSRKRERRLARC